MVENFSEQLMAFFKRIIDQDDTLTLPTLAISEEANVVVSNNGSDFIFTLPSLYQMLLDHGYDLGKLTYKTFRKAVYSSDINAQLKSIGFTIEILFSSKKVNTNYYKLVAIDSNQ